jgi:hypothetical protein
MEGEPAIGSVEKLPRLCEDGGFMITLEFGMFCLVREMVCA